MPRDTPQQATQPTDSPQSSFAAFWWRLARAPSLVQGGWLRIGLPAKLLCLTALFVMLAEVLIFLPSISNFRVSWLNDRIMAAQVSALAAETVPGRAVPPALRNELLRTALVRAIAIRRGGARLMVLPPVSELNISAHFDLRENARQTLAESLALRLAQIRDAIGVFLAPDDRVIRITGLLGPRFDDVIEVVLPEEPLRRAMVRYGMTILWLSVLISLITAALVYFAISRLLVKPMTRISRNMVHFRENPEDASRIITPSGRHDEIGLAEQELAAMQRELTQMLVQKNRLAQLGLAVSKVNHDLRNLLANAQLISDRLSSIPDPTVQRFAPKLIASLDRAINFCNDSLKFGRAEEAAPRRELIRLKPLVADVTDGYALPRDGQIALNVSIDDGLRIDADRDQLFRIMTNLVRNAVQAIESQGEPGSGTISIKGWRDGRKVFVEVHDTGPGVPPAVRERLFKAFQGSTKKGGTGLGLSIAAELVHAHGGTLKFIDTEKGATFMMELPDRAAH